MDSALGAVTLDQAIEDRFSDPHSVIVNPYSDVVKEIAHEAERLRTSGAISGEMEKELDELFFSLVPFSGSGGRFGDGLLLAEKAAHLDLDVPLGSRLLGGIVLKKLIAKAIRWYLSYLSTQVTKFAALILMLARMLDERVTAIEEEVGIGRTSKLPIPPKSPRQEGVKLWRELVLEGSKDLRGRVLHAECGDGWLVRDLVSRGIEDAYGVDPDPLLLPAGRDSGLQLFPVQPMEHLLHLPDESLGGLVLSGFVDTLSLAQIVRLMELAAAKMVDKGALFIISLYPDAFYRLASPIELDLASGHPLHPDTWQLLLEKGDFEGVTVYTAESSDTGPDGDRPDGDRPDGDRPEGVVAGGGLSFEEPVYSGGIKVLQGSRDPALSAIAGTTYAVAAQRRPRWKPTQVVSHG